MPDDATGTSSGAGSTVADTPDASGEGDETTADRQGDYSEREDELAVYEWVGMLAAGFGFFLTPLFTTPVAGYCAYRIRRWKPATAVLIAVVVFFTAVFWVAVVLFVIP